MRLEYAGFVPLDAAVEVIAYGIQTKKDDLFIDLRRDALAKRMQRVIGTVAEKGAEGAAADFGIAGSSGWSLAKLEGIEFSEDRVRRILYRPFDWRWIYYEPRALGRARYETMQHMLEDNLGLIVMRQVFQKSAGYSHVGVSDALVDERTFYSNRGGTYLVPMLLRRSGDGLFARQRPQPRARHASSWPPVG